MKWKKSLGGCMKNNYNIKYMPNFKRNFNNILYSISHKKELYNKFKLKLNSIKLFPNMYSKINNSNIRKFLIDDYIILYQVSSNTINILNIIPKKSKYFNK